MVHGINGNGLVRRASDAPVELRPSRTEDLELLALLAAGALDIWFQPQFDLSSGKLVGAEALARLPGDEGGAGLFRRAAAAGLAERLSRAAQRRALSLAAEWQRSLRHLSLSLNVLPGDLARPNYPEWIAAEAVAAGIGFERLTIEVTEDALIEDVAAVSARLEELRWLGIAIALDDFGSGFASLAQLARLPLDIVKIDRGLIEGIEHGERERVVVRNVLRLARELHLTVIVEGVESAGQLELLRSWGCDLFQGFIRARPMPLSQFRRFAELHA